MSDGYWQLEGNAAELYQRYLVPVITTKWAEDLVARARLRAGDIVLDVACGTGVVARLAAKRAGQVTGLDLNAGMLAVARTLENEGPPISWMDGSALDLPFQPESFDVVLCQLGLQFFPDQLRALHEMRRVLREGGRAAFSVFSPIERTPGANAFVRALDEALGPESFADQARRAFLCQSGAARKAAARCWLWRHRCSDGRANDRIPFCARLCPHSVCCDTVGKPTERQGRV